MLIITVYTLSERPTREPFYDPCVTRFATHAWVVKRVAAGRFYCFFTSFSGSVWELPLALYW